MTDGLGILPRRQGQPQNHHSDETPPASQGPHGLGLCLSGIRGALTSRPGARLPTSTSWLPLASHEAHTSLPPLDLSFSPADRNNTCSQAQTMICLHRPFQGHQEMCIESKAQAAHHCPPLRAPFPRGTVPLLADPPLCKGPTCFSLGPEGQAPT